MRKILFILLLICSTSYGSEPCKECPSFIKINVRPTELDVNGHVNNAKYVEYLQWARWDWLDKHKFSRDNGIIPVVVNINVSYLKECSEHDKLDVMTWLEKIGNKSLTFKHIIAKEDGTVTSESTIVLVMVDKNTHKSVVIPDTLKRTFMSCVPGLSLQN